MLPAVRLCNSPSITRSRGISPDRRRDDLERALRSVTVPVQAIAFARDWLGPESSLRFLLSKLASTQVRIARLDAAALGATADHFAWMRFPEAVASALTCSSTDDMPAAARHGA